MPSSESETRSQIIDQHLLDAGWDVSDHTKVIEEYHLTHAYSQPNTLAEPAVLYNQQFSDYVLLGKNGKPLAVVEAKKSTKNAELGREQAKQYCEKIAKILKPTKTFAA